MKAESKTKAETSARYRSDAELEREIRARFAKSKIAREGFQVRVTAGVARIEGQTSVIQRKGTATRLARSAGARAVDNRIEVTEEARRRAAANIRPAGASAQGPRKAEVR